MITPGEQFGELFRSIQSDRLFPDSKTFADAKPQNPPEKILQQYRQQREQPGFDLAQFVAEHFRLPKSHPQADLTFRTSPARQSVREHIAQLWDQLTRVDEPEAISSSRIVLPRPYLVPGGRFRELYYWDSYFSLLGLAACGRLQAMRDLVDNFAFLINTHGFIPNSSRSYHQTRSQPPFFVLMVELLADAEGDPGIVEKYLPALENEYAFWMKGAEQLEDDVSGACSRRVVSSGAALLNRYWDDVDQPRDESYFEDVQLAEVSRRDQKTLFRDLRAACESGWDFSSRWLANGTSLDSIQTSRILPVDLNCLLHKLETVLASACASRGEGTRARRYRHNADQRKAFIQERFYDGHTGFFTDLLIPGFEPSGAQTLAAVFPLTFGLATESQADSVAHRLEQDFLRPGGWVTTPLRSGQQWDAPNGWAPLQWMVYVGLQRYGFHKLAQDGARRWVQNNLDTYRASGLLLEKYNVEEGELLAGGGEYAVQAGFGWTNGVLLRLMDELEIE